MRIIIIGFMAAGKTTLARSLADILKLRFIDMDHAIEDKTGRKIKEIFTSEGEAYFRALECSLAEELSELDNCVISTGGGVVTTANTMHFLTLKKPTLVLWLATELETILSRLEGESERPLNTSREHITQLYKQRLALYQSYSSLTCTPETPLSEIAFNIGNI
jgi:shikimate kinase